MIPNSVLLAYSLGGEEPKKFKFSDSGNAQELPANCIGIIFNSGCKISNLKGSKYPTVNIASAKNFASDDLTDDGISAYFVKGAFGGETPEQFLTHVTLEAGSCYAVTALNI